MVVPKFVKEIKLINIDDQILTNVLRLLGFDINNEALTTLLSVKEVVSKDNPGLKVEDLLNDKEFVEIIKKFATSSLKNLPSKKSESMNSSDSVLVHKDALVKCPICEAVGPIYKFAPKILK